MRKDMLKLHGVEPQKCTQEALGQLLSPVPVPWQGHKQLVCAVSAVQEQTGQDVSQNMKTWSTWGMKWMNTQAAVWLGATLKSMDRLVTRNSNTSSLENGAKSKNIFSIVWLRKTDTASFAKSLFQCIYWYNHVNSLKKPFQLMPVDIRLSFYDTVDKLLHFPHKCKSQGYMSLTVLIIGASVVGNQFTAFQK